MSLQSSDPKRELLRHALATVAYRGAKALSNSKVEFQGFTAPGEVRTPGKILAHMGDLMDWALSIAEGRRKWHDSEPLGWEQETQRFFAAVKKLDDYLESNEPLHAAPEKLLQGAIADSLTHIGQLNMLRRMAGTPVKGESYYEADVVVGRVGRQQTPPKKEF